MQTATPPWLTHTGVVAEQTLVAQGSAVTQRRLALQVWPAGQLLLVHLQTPSVESHTSPALQATPWQRFPPVQVWVAASQVFPAAQVPQASPQESVWPAGAQAHSGVAP
jgi:hypothetical protein